VEEVAVENVTAVLEATGAPIDVAVKVAGFGSDVGYFEEIHAARAEYFTHDYPASTLVEMKSLVSPDPMIDIKAIAVTPA
jgi:2-iminobutanoate/2-iminopropanoate deaminase